MKQPAQGGRGRSAAAADGRSAAPRSLHASLDRQSPLPLYAQVERRLKAMISAGEYPQDRFHSELEICEMLGVSRATARQAMQKLAAEGWLLRHRGHGSFVNPDKFDESFNSMMDLPDQWANVGRPLQIRLTRFAMAKCPAEFASMLGVGESVEVLCVERARVEQTTIISYDYRYVHPNFAYDITRAEAASNVPLLESLRRSTKLLRAENRIEASLAGTLVARLLGTRKTEAVLVRETCYFGDDGMPVICGRSYYRADKVRCSFSVEMGANTAKQPSWGPVDAVAPGTAVDKPGKAPGGTRTRKAAGQPARQRARR